MLLHLTSPLTVETLPVTSPLIEMSPEVVFTESQLPSILTEMLIPSEERFDTTFPSITIPLSLIETLFPV